MRDKDLVRTNEREHQGEADRHRAEQTLGTGKPAGLRSSNQGRHGCRYCRGIEHAFEIAEHVITQHAQADQNEQAVDG